MIRSQVCRRIFPARSPEHPLRRLGGSRRPVTAALLLVATALAAAPALAASHRFQDVPATEEGSRSAHWLIGTYSKEVLVWDEATEEVIDRIPVKRNIAGSLTLSSDRSRLYVSDPFWETIEIIALPSKESLGEFTLSEGSTRTWIRSLEVHPSLDWAAMLVHSRTKLVDRYEIGEPLIVKYDLQEYQVTDTIPWPDEELSPWADFRFSPGGDLLYMFADDLVALDAASFEEVDRWEISEPFEPGLGRMSLPFRRSPYQEENGVYTGLFRMTDPIQNRRLMGFATVDMARQEVEFEPIGPSEGVSFSLSPDGSKGYGLKSEIGHYEMWKFDLENRRVSERIPFAGRPRMALMPSADGRRLFIYNAGNTIDVYDEETFEHLRTVTLDADMTDWAGIVVISSPG